MVSGAMVGSADVARAHRNDIRLSVFVAAYFLTQAVNFTIKRVLPVPLSMYSAVSTGFSIVLIMLLCMAIKAMLRRAFLVFVTLEGLWAILYLSSLLLGESELSLLLPRAYRTLGVCIPIAVCAWAVRDKQVLYDIMLKSSHYSAAFLSPVFFVRGGTQEYSMTFSYILLLPTLFHINEWFRTGRGMYAVLFALELLAIILYGARGPIISICVMFLLRCLLTARRVAIKVTVVFGFLLAILLFLGYFDEIGSVAISFLEGQGYYSRTVFSLFERQIADNSARSQLLRHYWSMIQQRPLFGWGLVGGWIESGLGPHNTLIELLLALGCVFGGIICLVLIAVWFRCLLVRNAPLQNLLIVFASYNSVMYLVMGDFLGNVHFFVFVLLCFSGSTICDHLSQKGVA